MFLFINIQKSFITCCLVCTNTATNGTLSYDFTSSATYLNWATEQHCHSKNQNKSDELCYLPNTFCSFPTEISKILLRKLTHARVKSL